MVSQIFTQSQLSVSFQSRQYFDIVEEINHHFCTSIETFCITFCPPVGQVTILVILTTLIIESVSHFMTDYYTDSTIVECVISVHLEERILQDTCREADFVSRRIIISIYSLWSHQPFILINRFSQTAVHIIQSPFVCTASISPIRVLLDVQI